MSVKPFIMLNISIREKKHKGQSYKVTANCLKSDGIFNNLKFAFMYLLLCMLVYCYFRKKIDPLNNMNKDPACTNMQVKQPKSNKHTCGKPFISLRLQENVVGLLSLLTKL